MRKWVMLCLTAGSLSANSVWADESQVSDLASAFKDGSTKITIGSYVEATDKEADGKDTSWGTAFVDAKYETAEWNRLTFGVGFLGHHQLFSEADDGSDPFDKDIEQDAAISELYLKYRVGEKSNVVVGRYNHKKISHIDDSQSEGAYVQFKEIENLELIAGVMRKFAELDYDDGEDFGRESGSQDLTENDQTGDFLYFLEARADLADGLVKVNPYLMGQGDYATVTGLDTDLKLEMSENIDLGARLDMYNVFAEVQGEDDSFNWAFAPYVKAGNFKFTLGYAQFGDGMNKPNWLKDGLVGELDQDKAYGERNCSAIFGKVRGDFGPFWAHVAAGQYDYDKGSLGDSSFELELQGGYKITKNLDVNLRLFDVSYDGIDNKDYQKVEARLRCAF